VILLDTSGLLSALDASEPRHRASAAALLGRPGPRLLSPFVLAELSGTVKILVVDHTGRPAKGVRATLEVRQELTQPWGILHGGAIATLLDTAAGAGAVANLHRGQQSVTVEIKVNFIGAVRDGLVTVEAVPLHRGRSTMIWESRARDAEERIVAAALSTHMTIPAEPPAG